MKPETILYVAAIMICAALLVVLVVKSSEPINVELNGYSMQETDVFKGDVEDFMTIGSRFATTHTYSNNNDSKYNCINYTQDLAYIARQLGFKVQEVKGWPCENCTGHRWLRLEVDYEPQSGKFMDYSRLYPKQEVVR